MTIKAYCTFHILANSNFVRILMRISTITITDYKFHLIVHGIRNLYRISIIGITMDAKALDWISVKLFKIFFELRTFPVRLLEHKRILLFYCANGYCTGWYHVAAIDYPHKGSVTKTKCQPINSKQIIFSILGNIYYYNRWSLQWPLIYQQY